MLFMVKTSIIYIKVYYTGMSPTRTRSKQVRLFFGGSRPEQVHELDPKLQEKGKK